MQVCVNCKHFLANPDEVDKKLGWCRRYPPVRRVFKLVQTDDEGLPVRDALGRDVTLDVEEASFPPVQFSFYCGEWLSRDRRVHQDLLRATADYSFKPAPQEIAEGIETAKDHIAEAAGGASGQSS